jgi:hypothetical protein
MSTLQREATSMLAVLSSNMFASEEDAEGYVFIDRDPSLFISVLQYLREGRDAMQETALKANGLAINRELRYYGLQEMALPKQDVVVDEIINPVKKYTSFFNIKVETNRSERLVSLPIRSQYYLPFFNIFALLSQAYPKNFFFVFLK